MVLGNIFNTELDVTLTLQSQPRKTNTYIFVNLTLVIQKLQYGCGGDDGLMVVIINLSIQGNHTIVSHIIRNQLIVTVLEGMAPHQVANTTNWT